MRQTSMDSGTAPIGVYVHFPYCLNKCPYCDFVSYGVRRDEIDHGAYADAVLGELERVTGGGKGQASGRAWGGGRSWTGAAPAGRRRVESVFFGGGTPSLWDPSQLGRVLAGIRGTLAVAPGELEVTVECNPTSLDTARAQALVDVGVNRVSIGVQSLRDERLRYLGRLHDAAGGRRAVSDALRAGVPRVSADLIFGAPGQSVEEARDEVLELVDLGLDHLSCYQLTIEPGTRFGELARRGRLPLADDGMVADSFLAIDDALTARGFVHYEISNYARPRQQARHNLGYWRGNEYLGLGCAACGFARTAPDAGVRYRNDPRPDAYMAGAEPACENLDGPTLLRERIMLGLRTAEGIHLETAASEVGATAWTPERRRAAAWLEDRGRIARGDDGRLHVPRGAWLWTDDTAARLF